MAKKKKRGRSRSRPAPKSRSRRKQATALGLMGGAAIGGYRLIMGPTDYTVLSALQDKSITTMSARLKVIADKLAANAKLPETYMPVVFGIAVSASPRIPIIEMAAKPVDRAVKQISKGKVKL